MAWENYGTAFVIDQRAGARRRAARIIAWDYEAWSPTLGGRPGYNAPGNVVTGLLAGFEPAAVHAAHARAGSDGVRQQQQRRAVVRRRRVGGRSGGTGTVAERARAHRTTCARRSSRDRCARRQRLQNTFAHESFMDELPRT